MEIIKENTHNNNKTFRNCGYCIRSYSCDKCHGQCIFTIDVFKRSTESKQLLKLFNEKYFAQEFELLRSFDSNDLNNEDILFDSKDRKEIRRQLYENESFRLLKSFHNLEEGERKAVLKAHSSPYAVGSGRVVSCHCKVKKGNIIQGVYRHPKNENYANESKQEKIKRTMHGNLKDIYLI